MKVTSEDIRNLAEALPRVKKHMDTGTFINLCDCVEMAIEDFKKRLRYEEDEEETYVTLDEVIEARDRMNDYAKLVRKVNELAKKINEEYIRKCRSEYKIVYMGELVRKEEIPNDD